jgi:hypothetical protein
LKNSIWLGAVFEVDVPFYLLKVFEPEDDVGEVVAREYGPGELPEGKQRIFSEVLKQKVPSVVRSVEHGFQKAMAALTPGVITQMTTIRPLA